MNKDNLNKLDKMGEEIKLELAELFALSLTDNDFEGCDKLFRAYETYKRVYKLLQNNRKFINNEI